MLTGLHCLPVFMTCQLHEIDCLNCRFSNTVIEKDPREADLGENKNGETDVKIDLSTWVAGIGEFSNHFLNDLRLLSIAIE